MLVSALTAVLAGAAGAKDADVIAAFGVMDEHFNWNSAFALLSWSALTRSATIILYFFAPAFSTLSAMPSLRRVSICEVNITQAGSTFGVSGTEAVEKWLPLNMPSLAQPARATAPIRSAPGARSFLNILVSQKKYVR